MKILIPTDDCLTISQDFDKVNSFRFLTIINGTIRKDSFITSSSVLRNKYPLGLKELGDTYLSDEKTPDIADKKSAEIHDRLIVFASSISKESEKNLQKMQFEVFRTRENNILNALNVYLKDIVTMESDYCCQP